MGIFDLFRQIESGPGSGLQGKLTWLVVGLGNIGLEYENTRHNADFMAVEQLAQTCSGDFRQMKFRSDCGEAMVGGVRCLLMKPTTYMNLSGQAVQEAMRFYKLPPERLIVLSDDISLPVGKMRIRTKGSAGGHNGLKDIILKLSSDNFPRIKFGVGAKPNPEYDLADWVLGQFTEAEGKALYPLLQNTAEACTLIMQGKPEEAMSRFN